MMKNTIYICDHCGLEIAQTDKKYVQSTIEVRPNKEAIESYHAYPISGVRDLCEKCHNELADILAKFFK